MNNFVVWVEAEGEVTNIFNLFRDVLSVEIHGHSHGAEPSELNDSLKFRDFCS